MHLPHVAHGMQKAHKVALRGNAISETIALCPLSATLANKGLAIFHFDRCSALCLQHAACTRPELHLHRPFCEICLTFEPNLFAAAAATDIGHFAAARHRYLHNVAGKAIATAGFGFFPATVTGSDSTALATMGERSAKVAASATSSNTKSAAIRNLRGGEWYIVFLRTDVNERGKRLPDL